MTRFVLLVLTFIGVLVAPSLAGDAPFDPKPWLADLAQTRDVLSTRYANLEWAEFDREANLTELFADTQRRIESAQSETDARAAFDRLARRLGDGHVSFRWSASGKSRGSE